MKNKNCFFFYLKEQMNMEKQYLTTCTDIYGL